MALPLDYLRQSVNQQLLIELKDGISLNGQLVSVDRFMNVLMNNVIQTDPTGTRFIRLPTCCVKGNSIKGMVLEDSVQEKAIKEATDRQTKLQSALKINNRKNYRRQAQKQVFLDKK